MKRGETVGHLPLNREFRAIRYSSERNCERSSLMARVHALKEVRSRNPGNRQLCLQWCRFEHDDSTEFGYRFIWRTENESLDAARGQTRIPTIAEAQFLIEQALAAGWGNRDGDAMKAAAVELEKRGAVVNFGA